MPITAEQKADAGQRFLDAIKARIETRTKAQKDAAAKARAIASNEDDEDGDTPSIRAIAKKWIEARGLKGKIIKTNFDSEYVNNQYQQVIEIYTPEVTVHVPVASLPELRAAKEAQAKASAMSAELCHELQFLHSMVNAVAGFQAHVSRLWAPTGKGIVLSDARFKELLEDFLLSKRPAVCKAA